MPTIISDTKKTSWLPKMWKSFWIGKQRFLFIFHLTRLALGLNLDMSETGGSLNIHFLFWILKVNLFLKPDLLRKRLKKILQNEKKRTATPSLIRPWTIVSLSWDPSHLGLAIVLDPGDSQWRLNIHVLSLVLSVGIPIRPPLTAASRAADILYLEGVLEELEA